jgi:hypothetical protein
MLGGRVVATVRLGVNLTRSIKTGAFGALRVVVCLIGQTMFAVSAHAYSITLAWDRNPEPEVAGYRVYYGERRGEHPNVVDARGETQVKIEGLVEGQKYYFVAKAYTAEDLESLPSNEVAYGKGLPVAVEDQLAVGQGGETRVLLSGSATLLSNDTSPSKARLSAYLAEPPRNGTVQLNTDGSFAYHHDGGETTRDAFLYVATDGSIESIESAVQVTVLRTTRLELQGDEIDLGFTSATDVPFRVRRNFDPFVGNRGSLWNGPWNGTGEEVVLRLRDYWGGVFFRWEHDLPSGTLAGPLMGLFRLPIVSGTQFLSVPLHPPAVYRGAVASVGTDNVLLERARLYSGALAPVDGFLQYVLVCSPGPGMTGGDWWPILGNTLDHCWVDTRGRSLSEDLPEGSEVEIRPLLSLENLLGRVGSSGGLALSMDEDLRPSPEQEDLVQWVEPGKPAVTLVLHSGSLAEMGFYSFQGAKMSGPLDPSIIRLKPGQVFVLRRQAGAGAITVLGEVQTSPLAWYLGRGASFVGSHFPKTAGLSNSGLLEAGWKQDEDLRVSPGGEDLIAFLEGGALGPVYFYHRGHLAARGWYPNAAEKWDGSEISLLPGRGYLVVVHPSEDRIRWLQKPPFPWR